MNIGRMVLLALHEFLPGFVSICRSRSYGLHFDIKVVDAAIDNEIDLTTIRQKVRLVSDRSSNRFVVEQHLSHNELVNFFSNLPVVSRGISPAGRNRLL